MSKPKIPRGWERCRKAQATHCKSLGLCFHDLRDGPPCFMFKYEPRCLYVRRAKGGKGEKK